MGLSIQQHGDPRRSAARLPPGAQQRPVARDRREPEIVRWLSQLHRGAGARARRSCTTATSSASRRRWKARRCWRAPAFVSSFLRPRRCSCAFAICRSRCWRWRLRSPAQLHTAGVRTIGLLLELPRDGVVKRFGPQLCNFLDRLIGAAADPRPIFRLPHRYAAHFDFEFEVNSTEALLFPLRRMLREFAGFLRARDTGVQRFTTHVRASRRGRHADRHRPVACRSRRERFLALVREQLERLELPAPTIGLASVADAVRDAHGTAGRFAARRPAAKRRSLSYDRSARRPPGRSSRCMDCKQVADHRPEASWAAAPLRDASATTLQFPERPLWLLPEPKPLQLSVLPQIVAGPERIEGGWWDAGDVQRDYYVVHLSKAPSCGSIAIWRATAAGICMGSGHERVRRASLRQQLHVPARRFASGRAGDQAAQLWAIRRWR